MLAVTILDNADTEDSITSGQEIIFQSTCRKQEIQKKLVNISTIKQIIMQKLVNTFSTHKINKEL